MEKLKEVIQKIFETATNAPELNMVNYDENQVRDLNNAMIEIYYLAEGALAELSNENCALPIPVVSNSLPSEIKNFIEWLTKKDSEFSVLYGEKFRFATNEKDYTIEEVYEIYKTTLFYGRN